MLGPKDASEKSLPIESEFSASPALLLDVDPAEERKAVRKLDYTVLPVMAMFYFLSFLVSKT